ncbi:nitrogenase component 1 [Konateibacter massiliensis]|uniref:nitrogenase component 1 n=1 Tax=Konateibacter massiliensis TaxID=2002841 RepID=UPI000C1568E4|nr:nitrogenase component 1 [Konateibacter massiliensis]
MSNPNKAFRLSEIESNQGIRFSHAGATPGHHCPMHTALSAVRSMKGVSTLVVGMPECGFYSRYVLENPIGVNGELHYTYILDSNEVVFGCRDGLIAALEEMERDQAKAIVVVMTCIPALIGEDIAEITETFSEEHDTKAVCLDLAHYKRNGYEAGFYEIYAALTAFCDKPDPIKTSQRQVTLLGQASGAEADLLKSWISKNDYQITEINPRLILQDFIQVTSSCLTIVTHIHFLPLAKKLEKEYEIPFVFLGGAYSLSEIKECYLEIQTRLSLSDIPEFPSFSLAEQLEAQVKKELAGSHFIVTNTIEDILPLTKYLCSLSIKPCFLHLEEYQPWMKAWKEEIISYSANPLISYVVRKDAGEELLKESGFWEETGFRFSIGERGVGETAHIKAQRSLGLSSIGCERTFSLLKRLEGIWKEEHHATV